MSKSILKLEVDKRYGLGSKVEYDTREVSSGHFESTCTFLKEMGQPPFIATGTGLGKKAAENQAAKLILQQAISPNFIEQVDRPSSSTNSVAFSHPVIVQAEQKTDSSSFVLDDPATLSLATAGNAIGILQNHCDKERISHPRYDEERQLHANTLNNLFKCICTLNSYSEHGVARKVKDAKKIAAFKVMTKLGLRFPMNASRQLTLEVSPGNILHVPTVSAVPSNPEVLSTPPTPAPARSASSSSSSINQTPAQVRSTPTTPFAGSTINVFSNMSSSAPPSPLSSASTESRSSDSGYEQIGDSPPVPGTRSFLSATPSTSRDQFVPNNSQPDTNSTPGNANSTYTRNVPRDHTVEEITEDSLFPETDTTTEQLASKSIANLIKEDASKAAFLSELWKAPTDSIDVKIINKKPKVAYYPEQILGVGGFGTVYGGYLEIPSRKVAVKVTRRNDMEQKKCKELEILRSISHRNIVKYLFAAFEPDVCYLVLELASITLDEWVRKYAENCHHELRVQFCKDAATGLRKLHKLGIVHRDIKPNNVLLFFTDTDPVAKLTDFGISRVLDRRADGVTTDRGNRGTITYMPPEAQAANGKFNLPLTFDIFSLGLVLAFTMTGGTHIFSNKPHEPPIITACNIAVYGPESPNWNYISSIEHTALRNLLEVMIAKDTSQRSSMSRIVEHPFFWGTQRQFDFILAVSNDLTNAKNPAAADHCRKSITEAYKRFCHDEYGFLADWKERLAPEIREWMAQKDLILRATKKNGIGWREYQADSLLHLIKFIRDQDQHNGNWNLHPQLTTPPIFGTDGTRYSAYFIRTFPEISTVLFSLFHCPSFKDIQLKTKDFVSSEEGVVFKHWMPEA